MLANTQGKLHPLEEGLHALGSGLDVKAYAAAIGKARTTLQDRVKAARVFQAVTDIRHDAIKDRWPRLAELHAAPAWLWPALAAELVARGWTVEATRGKVAALRRRPSSAPLATDFARLWERGGSKKSMRVTGEKYSNR